MERQKLIAEVALEKARKDLVDAKASNDKTVASSTGESQGVRLATGVVRFFEKLNGTMPDDAARLSLYKFFNQQETATAQLGTTKAEERS